MDPDFTLFLACFHPVPVPVFDLVPTICPAPSAEIAELYTDSILYVENDGRPPSTLYLARRRLEGGLGTYL